MAQIHPWKLTWSLHCMVITRAGEDQSLEGQALGLAQGSAGTFCVTGWPDFKQQRNKSQPVTVTAEQQSHIVDWSRLCGCDFSVCTSSCFP